MKTLLNTAIKASRETDIDILGNIMVRAGNVYATNGRYALISEPVSALEALVGEPVKDNTLYCARAAKDGRLEECQDYTQDDLFMTEIGKKQTDKFTLDKIAIKDLRWLDNAQSRNVLRDHLACVKLSDMGMQATDGDIFKKVTLNPSIHIKRDILLPRRALRIILSLASEKKATSIRFLIYDNIIKCTFSDGSSVITEAGYGEYPDIDRFISSAKKGASAGTLSTFKIKKLKGVYDNIIGKNSKNSVVFNKQGKLFVVSDDAKTWLIDTDLKPDAEIALKFDNLIKLDISGPALINKNMQSIVITQANRLALIWYKPQQ